MEPATSVIVHGKGGGLVTNRREEQEMIVACLRITELLRAGADIVLVADLLGQTSTDTLCIYTAPTGTDRSHALDLLTTDA